MDPIIILQAGVASGTVLLFAALGEVFAERSGVLNLGVEGMMLIGAMTAFSVTIATGNPWIGLLAAMNVDNITVAARPRVAILAGGDELVPPGTPPGASQIVASDQGRSIGAALRLQSS